MAGGGAAGFRVTVLADPWASWFGDMDRVICRRPFERHRHSTGRRTFPTVFVDLRRMDGEKIAPLWAQRWGKSTLMRCSPAFTAPEQVR